ncbi:MAG: hypothetical protein IVW54_15210 [Candidatus Binataceae bacterium]|nr:hypothetical protein [Candidatus Binataceae bacterium]
MESARPIHRESSPPITHGGKKWLRISAAIFGMLLSVVLAVAIVMQEGHRLWNRDSHGHLYSPLLRKK